MMKMLFLPVLFLFWVFLFFFLKTTVYAHVKRSIVIDLAVIYFCGPRKVLPSGLLPKANERHDCLSV